MSTSETPEVLRRKIVTREEAVGRFGPGRKDKLVFTNGCFDLLHRGHVELLVRARELGDRLLVGLNSDESVRRLKGAPRPVTPEADRAVCLAGLEAVDGVVVFTEDTPAELIREVCPEIWVKGGDYRPEDLSELETLKSVGGQLVLIPLVEGRSTSGLLGRLAAGGGGAS